MAIKIMVVDDEVVTLEMIREILEKHDIQVATFDSAEQALARFRLKEYDLILSDYYMERMNGDDFLKEIRKVDREIPFLVITTNTDLNRAIQLMKDGANDYIAKPFIEEDLLFRIIKNIEDYENRKVVERVNKEQKVRELYNKSIINWKNLYATKDLSQTHKFISIFTRTINQSGGFLWLELLKSQLEKIDDDYSRIPNSIADLIIETSESNKHFFDNISMISALEERSYNLQKIAITDLCREVTSYIQNELHDLALKYKHNFLIHDYNKKMEGEVNVDLELFLQVIKELYINAVKYSPPQTPISLMIDRALERSEPLLNISIINYPRKMGAENMEGKAIVGIPEEYSELVFDIFYTIENFPTPLEEELWTNGTGLYIARKVLTNMGGWISNANGLDYTKGEPINYLKFKITLPYEK